jgi:hypothetical protein
MRVNDEHTNYTPPGPDLITAIRAAYHRLLAVLTARRRRP